MNRIGQFLWAGTMRTASIDERVRAMTAGGFTETSMFPVDLRHALAAGDSLGAIRRRLNDAGVRVSVLDPFSQWLPGWERPAGLADETFAFFDFGHEQFFAWAEELGVDSVTVIEPYGRHVPVELGAEAFATVCDRAAQSGLRVHLEFIPFTGIPDLAHAWEIVRHANRANGGLVMDVWHYFLGRPDETLLRSIPGEKVFVVQLADAPAERRGTLAEELYHRLAPGDGVFELVGLLRVLHDIGGLTSVGPEIFSDALNALPPEDAGRHAAATTQAVLDRARLPASPMTPSQRKAR